MTKALNILWHYKHIHTKHTHIHTRTHTRGWYRAPIERGHPRRISVLIEYLFCADYLSTRCWHCFVWAIYITPPHTNMSWFLLVLKSHLHAGMRMRNVKCSFLTMLASCRWVFSKYVFRLRAPNEREKAANSPVYVCK